MKSNNTRQLVREVISDCPETLNNVNLLLTMCWEREGVTNFRQLEYATPAGSIIRAKQYILKNEPVLK